MASVTDSKSLQDIKDWNEDEISAFLTRKNGLFKLKDEEILAIHEAGIGGAACLLPPHSYRRRSQSPTKGLNVPNKFLKTNG